MTGDGDALSVAEVSRRLRRAVEAAGARLWVQGEVTGAKLAASGHLYFSLKDEREDALLECVMYRVAAMRFARAITDGARVEVRGSASFFVPRGRVQLIADAARPRGRGALLEALEALKQRLAAEGLFRAEKKRSLPTSPRIVGVVTSATGAAVHDIARVAARRGGARLLVARASVQGAAAPAEIVRALDLLERVAEVDVIIVGRGGGAVDDLAAFQDERVVRRIARAGVPIVSAVGHEVDVTLADLAADVRAATPSQAAELVVPERRGQRDEVARQRDALVRAMRGYLDECRLHADDNRRRRGDPQRRVHDAGQLVDELTARLSTRARELVAAHRRSALELGARLAERHPRAALAIERGAVDAATLRLSAEIVARIAADRRAADALGARMLALPRRAVTDHRRAVASVVARLDALSPLAVLSRGYAVAIGADGKALVRAADAAPGDRVEVRLHEGRLLATVTAAETGSKISGGARR